jgi:hypothetical protein
MKMVRGDVVDVGLAMPDDRPIQQGGVMMSIFAVLLIGLFVIGAVGIVAVIGYGIVRSTRDKRTRDERLADEHGDIAPGRFKLTPGVGGDIDGGTGSL